MSEFKEYFYRYPHPAVTADCVVFGFDGQVLKVLLIQRGQEPFKGRWALPGGFLNENETLEQCALRELQEETGMKPAYMEQVGVYSRPDRDPRERVITVAFFALAKIESVKGDDDAAQAEWFATDKVPQLAFDHDSILKNALMRLRERIHFYPIGKDLLPEKFTFKELQNLYEAILNVKFDRRNFAKKMLHYDILTPLDERAVSVTGRRANLYSFNLVRYNELKQKSYRLEF